MKLLIVCALISLTIANDYHVRHDVAEQWQELFKPYENHCVSESGVSKEDSENFFIRAHYPDKSEFKSYIKCVFLKLKYIDEDGKINIKNIVTTAKGVDLDIAEASEKAVRNITDISEKTYQLVVNGVSRISKRYPPQQGNE